MKELVKVEKEELVETIDPETSKQIIAAVAAQNATVLYRIEPMENLSDREIEIWNDTVESLVPGHLTDKDRPQLANYCRAYAEIEFIDSHLKKMKEFDIDPFDKPTYTAFAKWQAMKKEQMAIMLRYGTAMRLTNSAFRTDETKKDQVIEHGDVLSIDEYE